jgi:hypothetical protein
MSHPSASSGVYKEGNALDCLIPSSTLAAAQAFLCHHLYHDEQHRRRPGYSASTSPDAKFMDEEEQEAKDDASDRG